MASSRDRIILFLVIVFLLPTACGGGKGASPDQVVRSFMQAIETFDEARAKSLVCQPKRAWVENSLLVFGDPAKLDETFAMRFENLSYQELRNDGDVVEILVQGQMWISFLGHKETQEISETHTLVRQKGRWLICDP